MEKKSPNLTTKEDWDNHVKNCLVIRAISLVEYYTRLGKPLTFDQAYRLTLQDLRVLGDRAYFALENLKEKSKHKDKVKRGK